ncbi:MAG TPA: hypothetical protein VGM54_09895 [Chthoniobacter sp.]|jgi:hypothetical protein
MSDFTIFNSYDGSTVDVSAGAVVNLNVGPGTLLVVTQLQAYAVSLGNTAVIVSNSPALQVTGAVGYLPSTFGSDPPVPYQQAVQCLMVPVGEGVAPGVYHLGVEFLNTVSQALGFILTLGTAAGGSAPLAGTLPAGVIDIPVDLLLRKVASTLLPQIDGFKATDNLTFAVIPSRGGTFVGSGITEIQLTLRPVGIYWCEPLVTASLDSPSVTGDSPNQYYELTFTLAQTELQCWFEAANIATAAKEANPPSVTSLVVSAELQFTEVNDDVTTVTSSDTFTFTIFQSVVSPSSSD